MQIQCPEYDFSMVKQKRGTSIQRYGQKHSEGFRYTYGLSAWPANPPPFPRNGWRTRPFATDGVAKLSRSLGFSRRVEGLADLRLRAVRNATMMPQGASEGIDATSHRLRFAVGGWTCSRAFRDDKWGGKLIDLHCHL